jgi:hypothetical protein
MDGIFSLFRAAPGRVGFDDVLHAVASPKTHIIISTLPENKQDVLLPNTLSYRTEEDTVNDLVAAGNTAIPVLIYGRDATDASPDKKHAQLRSLGFTDVHIYSGGMFEYLLLRDVYGAAKFPLEGAGARKADPISYQPAAKPVRFMRGYGGVGSGLW